MSTKSRLSARAASLARETLPILSLSLAGGGLFAAAGMPTPWLSGGAIAATAWALAGGPSHLPAPLRETAFLVLGVSMGTGLTPEALAGIMHWPLSMTILLLTVPLIVFAAAGFLIRFWGWAAKDAVLASVPGALSYVLAVALDQGADVRRVAISQSLRLVLIVVLVPLAFSSTAVDITRVVAPADAEPAAIALQVASGLGLGWLIGRLGMPAALLFGGLLASGMLHGSGLVTSGLPGWLVIASIVVTGANIGQRLAGTDLQLLREVLLASFGGFVVAIGTAALGAGAVTLLLGFPFPQTMLAFSPGGLDASIIMAYALGIEPAYVAAHQLARFMFIALTLPFLFGLFARRFAGKARDTLQDEP